MTKKKSKFHLAPNFRTYHLIVVILCWTSLMYVAWFFGDYRLIERSVFLAEYWRTYLSGFFMGSFAFFAIYLFDYKNSDAPQILFADLVFQFFIFGFPIMALGVFSILAVNCRWDSGIGVQRTTLLLEKQIRGRNGASKIFVLQDWRTKGAKVVVSGKRVSSLNDECRLGQNVTITTHAGYLNAEWFYDTAIDCGSTDKTPPTAVDAK